MNTRRNLLCAMAAVAVLPFAGAANAVAQDRIDLLTIVVGFPPGGATDTTARLVGEALTGTYADAVVIENRPGAAGRIAAAHVKNSAADGSTFLFTPAFPMVIHPHLYDDMPYDTVADFTPVSTTHFGNLSFSVGPGAPEEIETLEDYLAWVRENPDEGVYGAPVGGSQHFAGLMFAEAAGIELEIIAYPGGAPSVVDVLGGHIPAVITPLTEVLPHARDGSLRILAATARERSDLAPDIPTFHELGFEDVVVQDWTGLLAPAGTPDEIVERAAAAIAEAVMSDRVRGGMAELGMEAQPVGPAEFAEIVPESLARYGEIIEAHGIEVEE